MLTVNNLIKKYKDVTAVNDISFNVEPGKIFGLLGPNGAGKTTAIRTILNIIKPTSGEIKFNGEYLSKNYFNEIGYLPEDRGLYKKSKVIDILLYFASLKNVRKKTALERSSFWLKTLGIENLAYKKIKELSKGNQQKVQFISSVIHDPKLLILDEPFAGLDPINQQQIKEQLNKFSKEGKIIILSTHQMETAENLCSDILLMNNGKEVTKGNLSEIKKKFRSNNIRIEFEGNIDYLYSLPEIKSIIKHNNYYELQLSGNVNPGLLLRMISDKLIVNHFTVVEPTLNNIFLKLIKQNNSDV